MIEAQWTATRRLLSDGRRPLPRLWRGEPVTVPAVRVLRHVADAARRRVGLVSRVRLREPGRVPVLRLLRDGPRPPGGGTWRPASHARRASRRPRLRPAAVGLVGRALGAALVAARRLRHADAAGLAGAAAGLGGSATRLGSAASAGAGVSRRPGSPAIRCRHSRALPSRSPAIRRPAGPRPSRSPAYPPPGWGAPPPGQGPPRGWGTAPAGPPPTAWAPPPAVQPPATQPPAAQPPAAHPPGAQPPAAPPLGAQPSTPPLPEAAPVADQPPPGSASLSVATPMEPPPPPPTGPSSSPDLVDGPAGRPPAVDAHRPSPPRHARRVPRLRGRLDACRAPQPGDPQDRHDHLLGPQGQHRARRSGSTPRRSTRSRSATSRPMAAEITRHGGKIEKYIGDAIMAVFGLPRAHEDDALRAVSAAYGMTQALDRLNVDLLAVYGVEIAARTGVNTGEVVANTDENAEQRLATGDAVNVAARLEQAAPANEVLSARSPTASYARMSRSSPSSPSSSRASPSECPPIASWRSASAAVDPSVRRPHAISWSAATTSSSNSERRSATRSGRGGCRLATVVGEAGVGKTLLVDAFNRTIASRRPPCSTGGACPTATASPSGRSSRSSRSAVGIADDDTPEAAMAKIAAALDGAASGTRDPRPPVASVIGLTSDRFAVAEIFWGGARFLEIARHAPAAGHPGHRGRPLRRGDVPRAARAPPRHRRVAVGRARRRDRPHRADRQARRTGRPDLTCSPPPAAALEPAATAQLVEVILGGPSDEAIDARVVATSAEGNPLFVSSSSPCSSTRA